MSQNWHGHWTEETFRPKRLKNWEIPKWYPNWPNRHCVITRIEVNDKGHLLSTKKKLKDSQWEKFKGTWDMPKKITKQVAQELSALPQNKKIAWELYKNKHRNICKAIYRN